MQSINQLLDQLKTKHSISSDYKLAAYLGVVPGAVQHWRHGRSLPDTSAAVRIAEELELDPGILVAELEQLRAQNDTARAFWAQIAARLQAGVVHSALLALLVALGFTTTTPSAHATVTELSPSAWSVYYVKYINRIRVGLNIAEPAR